MHRTTVETKLVNNSWFPLDSWWFDINCLRTKKVDSHRIAIDLASTSCFFSDRHQKLLGWEEGLSHQSIPSDWRKQKQEVDVKSMVILWESTFSVLKKLMSNHQLSNGNQLFLTSFFSTVVLCMGARTLWESTFLIEASPGLPQSFPQASPAYFLSQSENKKTRSWCQINGFQMGSNFFHPQKVDVKSPVFKW